MNKYLKLGKFTIALPVALTGFLGYFMARPSLDLFALYTVFGIFLLALGSGALNQIQERHTDARHGHQNALLVRHPPLVG